MSDPQTLADQARELTKIAQNIGNLPLMYQPSAATELATKVCAMLELMAATLDHVTPQLDAMLGTLADAMEANPLRDPRDGH